MNKTQRLAKIESALKLCDWCKFVHEQDALWNEALRSLGSEPIGPIPGTFKVERCETCGQRWEVSTIFDTPEIEAEEAALIEIGERNEQAGRTPSREDWQRFIAHDEAQVERRREHYGAEIYDQAIKATAWPDVWADWRKQMEAAPTEAELAAKLEQIAA